MHTSVTFPTFSTGLLCMQRSFALRGIRMCKISWWVFGNAIVSTSFTERMKMLSKPDGFILFFKVGVDFFSTSELLFPKMKFRLRLIRARPMLNTISDNPSVTLRNVVFSVYTCRIAFEDNYHKKWMDRLAKTPAEFKHLDFLAKIYIIPAIQNQFNQKYILNSAPVRHIAIAMNAYSAFTGSYSENPFWYHQFDLRQIIIVKWAQPIVDFDTADNCALYVTTMKAMSFQDDIPSIPIDNFNDHYVLVFDLTSKQDATESCHYPEIVGEPLRLELNFTFLWNTLLISLYWENKCLRLQLTNLVLLEKTSKMDNVSRRQLINRLPLLKYRYPGSFPSDYGPTLDIDTFAIINTQPSKIQGEHWIRVANFCRILLFADFLGRKKHSFLEQQYEQIMPKQLQSHPSVCGFHTIDAAFHLIKIQQKKLQVFTILMYFHSEVTTCKNSFSIM